MRIERTDMLIRNTTYEDLDEVMSIYAVARDFMRSTDNGSQWGTTHPRRELIESDIEKKCSYVVEENGEILGVFFFRTGNDPTYETICDGKWLDDDEYGVIHRIAMKYQGRGVATFVYNHCFNIINNLRIDTHERNLPMQHSLTKNGFVKCGTIYLESGDSRIAYQKVNTDGKIF